MNAIHNILHPTDFSPPAEYAFRLACSLAQDHGAHLLVLHVAPPPPPRFVGYHATGVSPQQADERYFEDLRSSLRRLESPSPNVEVEHRLEEGDTATEILRVADESKCDLIVMGTHGRMGLSRLLLGSVAEQVLRRARCPVLATKLPTSDAVPTEERGRHESA
jgi:nucleotide-binding universal stress UspA family protein